MFVETESPIFDNIEQIARNIIIKCRWRSSEV